MVKETIYNDLILKHICTTNLSTLSILTLLLLRVVLLLPREGSAMILNCCFVRSDNQFKTHLEAQTLLI